MGSKILAGYDTLVVDGIEGILHIENLEVKQKINEHAMLRIQVSLKSEAAQNHIQNSIVQQSVRLCLIDGEPLFYGIITDSELETIAGVSYLTVTASSFTILLDRERKSRSWQNKEMTREAILRLVLADYPRSTFLWNEPESKEPAGQFLIQYKETDWEFCKRIGSMSYVGLYPDIRLERTRFCVGLPLVPEEKEIQHVQYRLRQNIEKIMRLRYNQSITGISEADILEYELKGVEERYALGDRVRFKGLCFIIAEISSYLSGNAGMLLHNYLLVTKGGSHQERIYNPAIKGNSVSGSVLDVSKGYTKLHLTIDQSQDSGQGEWFVQPSFYTGSGGYCAMPERGDVLSLHFPTEDERDCYIISAQGASGESLYSQIGNSAASVTEESMNRNKTWTTPGRRGLLLNDDQVKFHGRGGSTHLTLMESNGALVVTTGSIDISGESILLGGTEGPTARVELNAGKELLLLCEGSSIQMQSGSGDIQMYANEIKLESPRNAALPELLSAEEVALLLSEYEKQKTSYLRNSALYYMDASGYTGTDIDQARQAVAYKIIDGLAKGADELRRIGINIEAGFDGGKYHQSGESMNMLLDIMYGEDARTLQEYMKERDDIAYQDALIAALGDDYHAGYFEDGYTFGVFAHVGEVWVWLSSVASLGNALGATLESALGSSFSSGSFMGGAVTSAGIVVDVGGTVAITEAYEAEIAVAIAGLLAAAGFGNGQGASWKNKKYGHTFSRHGQGQKNQENLKGRAGGTGDDQGQWLDNEKAAEFLDSLGDINGVKDFDLPDGLGQVIKPNGDIVPANGVRVVPSSNGGIKTAYPISR